TYRWFSAELGDAVGAGAGAEVQGLRVSEDFLRIFGIQPVLGRGFTAGEDAAGGPSVALIGTGLWRSRFGGDRRVVGRELVLGDERYTIVGVVPTVRLPEAADRAEVLLPLRLVVDPREHGNNYRVVGKLRPGLPSGAVEADLARVMAEFRRAYPEEVQPGDRGLRVMDFRQLFVGQLARTLWILLGSVAFVLLIACANVASLFLARAVGRQREISLRAALGAARGRIVRQLLTEGLVLYLAAGALALALARLALLAAGRTFVSTRLLRAEEIALDGRVLLFTLAVAVVTALVFGAFVAVPASRSDLMRLLREAGAAAGGGGRSARFRRLLVGAESALAVVLLAGAGLLLASLLAVRSVDPRFEARGVVTATLPALPRTYASREAVWDLERRLLERIRAIPGVEGAATTANVPFRRGMNIPITIAGRPDAWEGAAEWRAVSPGYFDALRVGFVRGRDFDARDGAGAPGVVIINESLARRYWPGQDPIGQRI
ncbi:MAG: ABC transporter permease, partial [Gemmatimonadetes bacterium]|nr:ABC transporter permease [Gemmatimonadota bacterium]